MAAPRYTVIVAEKLDGRTFFERDRFETEADAIGHYERAVSSEGYDWVKLLEMTSATGGRVLREWRA